jgi:hypothetical protein
LEPLTVVFGFLLQPQGQRTHSLSLYINKQTNASYCNVHRWFPSPPHHSSSAAALKGSFFSLFIAHTFTHISLCFSLFLFHECNAMLISLIDSSWMNFWIRFLGFVNNNYFMTFPSFLFHKTTIPSPFTFICIHIHMYN